MVRWSHRGLSVLEMMLGVFLLFCTAVFVMNLFIMGAKQTANVSKKSKLNAYLAAKTNELLLMDFASAVTVAPAYLDPPDNQYQFIPDVVTPFDGNSELALITVEVRHPHFGSVRQHVVRSEVPPLDPGQAVWERLACNQCHTLAAAGYNTTTIYNVSLDGIGNWGDTRIAGYTATDYIEESVIDPNAFDAFGGAQGVMTDFYDEADPNYTAGGASSVSNQELTDLANWLAGLPGPTTPPVP